MNTKRILNWSIFIIIIGLIVWGMIAASNKASRENSSLPLPNVISENDWVTGNASSSVILVEYSDFQCPACAAYFPLVERIVEESSTTIKFVYRHFPLSQHVNAVPAAQAAEAAGKQGKFWEMYKLLFTNHDNWENSKDVKTIFKEYASTLGLDMVKYEEDVNSKFVIDKINSDLKSGTKAGINSTPTFYLNGQKINNPQGDDDFKKLIDDAVQPKIKS